MQMKFDGPKILVFFDGEWVSEPYLIAYAAARQARFQIEGIVCGNRPPDISDAHWKAMNLMFNRTCREMNPNNFDCE